MPNPISPSAAQRTSDKSVKLKAAFGRLASYARGYVPAVAIASVLAIVGAVLNLIGPGKLGEMTDIIQRGLTGTVNLGAVQSLGTLLAVLYGLGFALNYCHGLIMAVITQRLTQDMRRDLSAKIDRLPLRFLDSTPTGELLSIVTNDVDSVGQSMNQSLSTIVSSVAQLMGAVVMMLATNWLMAVSGIVAALVGMLLTSRIIVRSQPYFARQQHALGELDSQVEEVMGGLDVVRVSNGGAHERARFVRLNDDLAEANLRSTFFSGLMMPLMIFIGNLAYVVVCIVGGTLVINGTIDFGVVVSFMIYIRLFTQPLQNISQAATSVQTMAAACERVLDFLDEDEMADESGKTEHVGQVRDPKTGQLVGEPARGDVQFHHVRFGYEKGHEIIHDFNAEAKAGQKIAIVGPTGAGKTTMVNLLQRFYELDHGSIRIDGVRTRDITRENLHDQFSMVLQDTWFFEGTLRENIAFGTTSVTGEMLDEVCEACGLSGYVSSLPKGYDTVLEPESISAGQRQLITIARAMVKGSPLLILDEATSSVDTRTEAKVQRAMDTLMRGRASFVIAHRLSTIRDADLILYMEGGNVVEQGTHEELIAAGGRYAALYNSQFDSEKVA